MGEAAINNKVYKIEFRNILNNPTGPTSIPRPSYKCTHTYTEPTCLPAFPRNHLWVDQTDFMGLVMMWWFRLVFTHPEIESTSSSRQAEPGRVFLRFHAMPFADILYVLTIEIPDYVHRQHAMLAASREVWVMWVECLPYAIPVRTVR